MSYRLLASALDDLDYIDSWIASNFGQSAAAKTRRKLTETFERIAQFQNIGIRRPEVTSLPVRFFSSRPNWIIYEPGEPLLIHRIFPARTDIRDLIL